MFDVIGKLRELELSGDKNAAVRLRELAKIRQAADLRGSLKFEGRVLGLAETEIQLNSSAEHADLNRLAEDRNRCTHPSKNTYGEANQPSTELARCHSEMLPSTCLNSHWSRDAPRSADC